jgi:stage III sporulation protein AB
MTLRLICGAIVIFCGAMVGRALAKRLIRRADLIVNIIDGLKLMRVHALDGLNPISTALAKSKCALLRGVGDALNDEGLSVAWQEYSSVARRKGGELDCMGDAEYDALTVFFESLGASGASEQRRIYDSAIETLARLESEARKDSAEKLRLYTTLGALSGAAAAIAVI